MFQRECPGGRTPLDPLCGYVAETTPLGQQRAVHDLVFVGLRLVAHVHRLDDRRRVRQVLECLGDRRREQITAGEIRVSDRRQADSGYRRI